MSMNKYIKYISPVVMFLGIAVLIFGFVCVCSADDAIGRIEDAYYYLDLNLFHGRFHVGDVGDVLGMLDDIGLSDALVSGFERFAIGMRNPLIIVGLILAVAGAAGNMYTGFEISDEASEELAAYWKKSRMYFDAAIEWAKLKLSAHRCPVCGEMLMKGAAYCGNCGAVIEEKKD